MEHTLRGILVLITIIILIPYKLVAVLYIRYGILVGLVDHVTMLRMKRTRETFTFGLI